MLSTTPKDSLFARWTDFEIAAMKDDDGYAATSDAICRTDPVRESPFELVVDTTDGFVPLWAQGTVLNWRFQEPSLRGFKDKEAVKGEIVKLLDGALALWGTAVPVNFVQSDNAWDFEIVVQESNDCTPQGCALAKAFFPDAGRHEMLLFPRLFEQSTADQVETVAHELGHIFGLRHFFAGKSEERWPSAIFGTHEHFTIMNYGDKTEMTDADKNDLHSLYDAVWNGPLMEIAGVPIRLFQPYHNAGISMTSDLTSINRAASLRV